MWGEDDLRFTNHDPRGQGLEGGGIPLAVACVLLRSTGALSAGGRLQTCPYELPADAGLPLAAGRQSRGLPLPPRGGIRGQVLVRSMVDLEAEARSSFVGVEARIDARGWKLEAGSFVLTGF